MINKGDNYENINDMATMFAKMMHEMKNRNSNYQVNSYSRHGDNKMDKMRMMMKMMKMSNMMNDHSSSSYHSDDNDMYDMFSEMFDSSSGRMDNYRSSDYSNQMGRMSHIKNIDVQAMKRDIQKYTMPSERFKNKYEHLLDTCYEMATILPADIAENSVVTGDSFGTVKLGEVKMFTKCCEKAKTKLCVHQDIKKKVESNFGPMEDILQETQLTEHEFFPH